MGKIKLNLVSGAIVEKPLINAFKANNMEYVVLDNEMNGSMGLPIILVCKLENGKLTKIIDQTEWQIVKEYLKNIIAGNQIEFISIAAEMPADDIYYTQLTLPVPSFDALKNAYNSSESNNDSGVASILDINPSNPVTTESVNTENTEVNVNPVLNDQPVNPQVDIPVVDIGIPSSEPSKTDNVANTQINQNFQSSPVIDLQTPMPTMENTDLTNNENNINDIGVQPTSPVEPMPTSSVENVNVAPVVNEPVIHNNRESIFKEHKEVFMQACENMFDALVQKIEKELENLK